MQCFLFGSGQGSTVSATGWEKFVSIASDMYDKQRSGSHYSNQEGFFKTIIGKLGFVDDNNIQIQAGNTNLSKMSSNRPNTMRNYGMIF